MCSGVPTAVFRIKLALHHPRLWILHKVRERKLTHLLTPMLCEGKTEPWRVDTL